MADYTEQQIEEFRAAVAAADRAKAEAELEKRRLYLEPVKSLVEGDEFKHVRRTLEEIKATYEDDNRISFQLNAIVDIIPRLIQEVDSAVSAVAPPVTMPVTLNPAPTVDAPSAE